jgi:hypothetical protein
MVSTHRVKEPHRWTCLCLFDWVVLCERFSCSGGRACWPAAAERARARTTRLAPSPAVRAAAGAAACLDAVAYGSLPRDARQQGVACEHHKSNARARVNEKRERERRRGDVAPSSSVHGPASSSAGWAHLAAAKAPDEARRHEERHRVAAGRARSAGASARAEKGRSVWRPLLHDTPSSSLLSAPPQRPTSGQRGNAWRSIGFRMRSLARSLAAGDGRGCFSGGRLMKGFSSGVFLRRSLSSSLSLSFGMCC